MNFLMKRMLALTLFVLLGIVAWKIGSQLSADAVGLATGVLFGMLAGLPTAILVLASNRNRNQKTDENPPVLIVPDGGSFPKDARFLYGDQARNWILTEKLEPNGDPYEEPEWFTQAMNGAGMGGSDAA